MHDLSDLIDRDEDAWPLVSSLVRGAPHPVDVLPAAQDLGRQTLLALQVTTRSPMGTIALRTGGILIDHGWVRVLGSGSSRLGGGLREWNQQLGGEPLEPPLAQGMIVAYDAIGGFFALNGGEWPGASGGLHYLAPESHEWEDLDVGYTGMLEMLTSESFKGFYAGLHWPGWEFEVAHLGPDESLLTDGTRRAVPAREVWTSHHEQPGVMGSA